MACNRDILLREIDAARRRLVSGEGGRRQESGYGPPMTRAVKLRRLALNRELISMFPSVYWGGESELNDREVDIGGGDVVGVVGQRIQRDMRDKLNYQAIINAGNAGLSNVVIG